MNGKIILVKLFLMAQIALPFASTAMDFSRLTKTTEKLNKAFKRCVECYKNSSLQADRGYIAQQFTDLEKVEMELCLHTEKLLWDSIEFSNYFKNSPDTSKNASFDAIDTALGMKAVEEPSPMQAMQKPFYEAMNFLDLVAKGEALYVQIQHAVNVAGVGKCEQEQDKVRREKISGNLLDLNNHTVKQLSALKTMKLSLHAFIRDTLLKPKHFVHSPNLMLMKNDLAKYMRRMKYLTTYYMSGHQLDSDEQLREKCAFDLEIGKMERSENVNEIAQAFKKCANMLSPSKKMNRGGGAAFVWRKAFIITAIAAGVTATAFALRSMMKKDEEKDEESDEIKATNEII